MSNTLKGSELAPDQQREALARFVHRYTGDHTPKWVSNARRAEGKIYPVQFRDDRDWLANTDFEVTSTGKLRRNNDCFSRPTWPQGNKITHVSDPKPPRELAGELGAGRAAL